jgi:hypothetical protein
MPIHLLYETTSVCLRGANLKLALAQVAMPATRACDESWMHSNARESPQV